MRLDFLKKIKKNEIMAFVIVACIIIIVGYYFIFLSPLASKFTSLLHKTSALQSTINTAELSINSMPKIKREIEELKSREGFYSNKLPREEEFPAVLEDLSNMAQNSGVKMTKILPMKDSGISVKENADLDIYRQKAILINAQCEYHQLGAFIAELENAERFMEISDIVIQAGRVNPKRHNVQLIVKTFILKGEGK